MYLCCALLAVGQFALVTSVFMLTGVLTEIADEFKISVGVAGQVLSIFSITFAISAPVLAVITAHVNRKTILAITLLIFLLANLFSAWAPEFGLILYARVVAAAADGLYAATAISVAAALAPPHMRGRALAVFNFGATIALFMGVSLSTFIGIEFGWRATFVGVALVAGVASIGIFLFFPSVAPVSAAGLKERLRVIAVPGVFPTLVVACLSHLGMFSVYAFLTPILLKVAGIQQSSMGFILLTFGFAAVIGNWLGGQACDRWGADRSLATSLVFAAPLLAGLPVFASSSVMATLLVFLWGAVHYLGLAPLQLRLASLFPANAGIVLALNNSFIYIGVAVGAAVGGTVIDLLPVEAMGLVGASFKLMALVLLIWTLRATVSPAHNLKSG